MDFIAINKLPASVMGDCGNVSAQIPKNEGGQ